MIEPASLGAAQRALSAYDKAWTNYTTALRLSAAGALATGGAQGGAGAVALRASVSGLGAVAFLSSDAQTGMSRALYLEAQLAWSRQASNTLAAAPRPEMARPDAELEARATLRLHQAADLANAAPGAPIAAAQARSLLDEADQAHRAWVGEWAKYLAELIG